MKAPRRGAHLTAGFAWAPSSVGALIGCEGPSQPISAGINRIEVFRPEPTRYSRAARLLHTKRSTRPLSSSERALRFLTLWCAPQRMRHHPYLFYQE
ncbi:hypothetical protein PF008_g11560 [Phytophthora fragariae]|uniref:Uncharacterized protein n=1 Tax=Phytophthora fragariae TaxID=53985 RepID=A0A6G0RQZ2_9STRA|nr:hypothetical protein PF008_g11560 [Phytophthora fragariae]